MSEFVFPEKLEIRCRERPGDSCFDYAVSELARLLCKLNVTVQKAGKSSGSGKFCLIIVPPGAASPAVPHVSGDVFPDAYALEASPRGIVISANSGKGILNGIYDLSERLGFVFLMPGEEGEWIPEIRKGGNPSIKSFRAVMKPRFKYRGVFYCGLTYDFELGDWLKFFAKLRFNAVSIGEFVRGKKGLLQQLGLHAEAGQHGYRDLLPRNLFAKKPDLFRMRMPDDFGGKRVDDYNSCAVNAEARKIMRRNFLVQAKEAVAEGYHALHLWPDDLPGGGWCMCPLCRGFGPSDQAMLAMRNLAEAVRGEKLPMRVPMIAYHDTMEPNGNIPPAKENFLLFAPRERCYGHGLDDPHCAKNRFYLKALAAWVEKFKGIDDAHTFEYYFDRILYRGMCPYLPDVIAGDMRTYEKYGMETHMALQVGGPTLAPEWNMLFFSRLLWDSNLSPAEFNSVIDAAITGGSGVMRDHLDARAEIFTSAMRMCDYENDIYLDYRWLPENTLPFGREMAKDYLRCSVKLAKATDRLLKSPSGKKSRRLTALIGKEAARSRFEAAELAVMSHQQDAVNNAACHLAADDKGALRAAIASGEAMIEAFKPARELAGKSGISEKAWYFRNINRWISEEMERKIKVWRKALPVNIH
ncbi:MAG: DUF4838 domain-containing protein [Victivallales bacterium]